MSNVELFAEYRKKMVDPTRERELKKLAIQLAAQLPDDMQDALDALEHAKTLVRSFLAEPEVV